MTKKRIYCGPDAAPTSMWWTVNVRDAKTPVTINGELYHALKAQRGVTIGCALSNVAMDSKNKDSFPHPAYFVSVMKSKVFVIDKLNAAGQPISAVRYDHSYGSITECNDKGTLKRLAQENPQLMGRSFTLRVPKKQVWNPASQSNADTKRTPKGDLPRAAATVHRGALARAVKAGRIAKPIAAQMEAIATQAAEGVK